MGKACCFRDYDLWHRPDESGMNKVGYITSRNTVVYQVRLHFVEVPLRRLRRKRLDTFELKCSEERKAQVEAFFTMNVLNPGLMERGFSALTQGPHDFFDSPVRLPKLLPVSRAEHQERWDQLPQVLVAGDLVQVFNEKSLVSKVIAVLDHGSWSHSAMYTGDQTVTEAITSGISERPISVYKNPSIRLGVYRHPGMTVEKARTIIAFGRTQLGKPYGWRQAFVLGVEQLFCFNRRTRTPSPNDLIARSDLQLIFLI